MGKDKEEKEFMEEENSPDVSEESLFCETLRAGSPAGTLSDLFQLWQPPPWGIPT